MIDLPVLVLLMVGATWFGGWWGVPLVAAGWAWWWGWRRFSWRPALAAALAWGGLLLLAGPEDSLLVLLHRLSEIFNVPDAAVVLLALGYVAVLAWAAARLMQGLGLSRSK